MALDVRFSSPETELATCSNILWIVANTLLVKADLRLSHMCTENIEHPWSVCERESVEEIFSATFMGTQIK